MYIEVMYGDESIVRVPITKAATLSNTGVLFMILSAETTEAMSRRVIDGKHYRRVREMHGVDHYAFMTIDDGTAPYYLLWGWDDQNYAWVDGSNPFVDYSLPDPRRPEFDTYRTFPVWMPPEALIFEGQQVTSDEWRAAQKLFSRSMH